MQIDGHHALTYIAARLAGFTHARAGTIAHAAQYVDDATNGGSITFDNGAMYWRIASAHRMLDHRNLDTLANHKVWIPFHFLPGNGGRGAGKRPRGGFIQKLVCRPDSPVAREMLAHCIAGRDRPYALHRLGITMHVYADTFAHQGFAGVNHKINEVSALSSSNKRKDRRFFERIKHYFISEAFPLGHGAALEYPDLPWLKWRYRNGNGQLVERDNAAIFLEAADKMCRAMYCYRTGDLSVALEEAPGLPKGDAATLRRLLRRFRSEEAEVRHGRWLDEIAAGAFSFGAAKLRYQAKGVGSWKHKALRQAAAVDTGQERFPYQQEFLHSDWKMFHDALLAHRFAVVREVLPRYGICVA
ncbi:MAG: DUF6765 family protein [Pseudomonadota bacterium]